MSPATRCAPRAGRSRTSRPAPLDGGPDGLDLIRRLLRAAPAAVRPGGTLLLEVGAGQADAVRGLAPPGSIVETRTDMAGIERVVRIGLPSAASA